jgi:hypothetical protein
LSLSDPELSCCSLLFVCATILDVLNVDAQGGMRKAPSALCQQRPGAIRSRNRGVADHGRESGDCWWNSGGPHRNRDGEHSLEERMPLPVKLHCPCYVRSFPEVVIRAASDDFLFLRPDEGMRSFLSAWHPKRGVLNFGGADRCSLM